MENKNNFIRNIKLNVRKSGGTASKNSVQYSTSIPTSWINLMGLDKDNRDITLIFDDKNLSITIKKTK